MADYPSLVLTGKQVSNTYLNLLQTTDKKLISAAGNIIPHITASVVGTSSWSENSISASWSPFTDTGTILYTGSTYQITASKAISASWAPFTQTYQASGSWASQSLSASYAPVEPAYSASVSNQFGTKQNTLTNTLYVLTASLATSASYYPAQTIQTTVASASWASASVSSSYAITASFALNGGPATYTSSLYGTASWSNNSISASYVSGAYSQIDILSSSTITVNRGAKIGGMSEGLPSVDTIQIGATDAGVPLPDPSYKRDGAVQIGWGAGQSATTASNAVQIGIQAGTNTKLADNAIQLGVLAGAGTITASNTVQIGASAGQISIDATNAVQIGSNAGVNATTAISAVQIGSNAGFNARTGSYTTFVGSGADTLDVGLNVEKSIAIGYNAKVSASNTCVIGGTGADAVSVAIGKTSAAATLDVNGNINALSVTASLFGTASYSISASWSPGGSGVTPGGSYNISASWASQSLSASWAPGGSGVTPGGSYDISASWASQSLSASWAPSTPSDYSISASWASQSLSASWAPGGSGVTPGGSYDISASWASASLSASYLSGSAIIDHFEFIQKILPWSSSIILDLSTKNIQTLTGTGNVSFTSSFVSPGRSLTLKVYASGSAISSSWPSDWIWINANSGPPILESNKTGILSLTSFGTTDSNIVAIWADNTAGSTIASSSWSQFSLNSLSASWASSSISASYAPFTQTYQASGSWASQSLSASYAPFTQAYQASGSWASSSLSASYAPVEPSYSASVSTAKQNTLVTGNTYTITSSWAENAVNGGTTLGTGSTYPITASWSNNATSASYAPFTQTYQASGSWASQSLSASWAPMPVIPSTDSASWASASISSSYAPVEPAYSASVSTVKQNTLVTGATYPITSSWAVSSSWAYSAITASYSNYYDVTIYHESSSYASSSTSSSYAPVQPSYSSSVSSLFGNKQDTLVTGNTYPITSSWSNNATTAGTANAISFVPVTATSASWASSSISASYVPDLYPQTEQVSSSWASSSISASFVPNLYPQTYQASGSWASSSLSASYAPVQPSYSSSVSSQFGTKQDTLVTGNTYTITSSWSVNATTAGTANAISFVPLTATSASWASSSISASYAPFTQTYQASGSWASQSLSSSYAPVEPAYSASVSSQFGTKQNTLTNTLYVLTASLAESASYYPSQIIYASSSWASQSLSASYAPNLYPQVEQVSASWASASLSASFAPRNPSGSIYLLTSSSITFQTSSIYGQSGQTGRVFWDEEDVTLAICNSPNVTQQVGQEILLRVCANENIPNGGILYATTNSFHNTIKGTSRQVVGLAIADGTGLRSTICGVATETITSGSRGFMAMVGDIHGLNTDAFTEGLPVYLSTTQSGSVTQTRPSPPYEQVYVGVITNKSATEGIITVNIANPPFTSFISNAGMTSLPTISGSVNNLFVSGNGTVNLYNNASGSDTVKNYFLSAYTGSIPNTGSTYYLVANYNGGIPVYDVLSSTDTINNTTITPVATIIRPIYKPNQIEYIFHDQFGYALANKLNQRFIRTERYAHETGLTLAESASRVPTISAGAVWFGGSRITTTAVNGAINSYRLFRTWPSSSTGWSSSLVTQYNNNEYDNGAGSLVALSGPGTQYAVNFIFRSLAEGDNDIYSVLGRGNYSLAQAQASTVPSPLVDMLSPSAGLSVLVGRIIVAQGDTTAYQIDSAWETTFQASAGTDHNALSNLQGGTAGEYYHLTSAEYTTLQSNTSSYANRALSASYAPVEPTYSASVSTAKQNTLVTGNTYTITSSWATNATTAGTANAISFVPLTATSASWVSASVKITTADTASYIAATNVVGSITALSSSWASSSLSASYAPFTQTYQVSSSWASASLSASYAPFTQTYQVSSSWASSSLSSSYSKTSSFYLDPTNVKYYGAKGDGVTDDTVAIQNAFNNAISSSGGRIYFPAGTYQLSSSITISYPTNSFVGLVIEGDSSTRSTLQMTSPDDCFVFNPNRFSSIKHLNLIGYNQSGSGIKLEGPSIWNSYDNLSISYFENGIYFAGDTLSNNQFANTVINCGISSCYNGISSYPNALGLLTIGAGNEIRGCYNGFIGSGVNICFDKTIIESNTNGITLFQGYNYHINNCHFEANSFGHINLSGSGIISHLTVQNNWLVGSESDYGFYNEGVSLQDFVWKNQTLVNPNDIAYVNISNTPTASTYNWEVDDMQLWTGSFFPSWAPLSELSLHRKLVIGGKVASQLLDVKGNIALLSGNKIGSGLNYGDSTKPTDNTLDLYDATDNGMLLHTGNTNPISIKQNGILRFRVSEVGNIGIGVVSPSASLEIRGLTNTSFIANDFSEANTSGSKLLLIAPNGADSPQIQSYTKGATVYADIILQPIYGNVGIGATSPGSKLHVQGNISASSVTASLFGTSSWAQNSLSSSYVRDAGGQVFNAQAYGWLPDGIDRSVQALALLQTVYNSGGGTIYFPPVSGSESYLAGNKAYRADSQLLIPNDNPLVAGSQQPNIRMTGAGTGKNWYGNKSSAVVDLRYTGSNGAKILTLGAGTLQIDNLTIVDAGLPNSTPFVYTTYTVLKIEGNSFIGSSTASQDCIILGGTTASVTSSIDSPFGGYGTVINNNAFRRLGRGVLGRTYSNGVVITNNSWHDNPATGSSAIEFDCTAGGGHQNIISNNLIEMNNYRYGITLTNCAMNTMIGNGFYDMEPISVALYNINGTSGGQVIIDSVPLSVYPWVVATTGSTSLTSSTRIHGGNIHNENSTMYENLNVGGDITCSGSARIGAYSASVPITTGIQIGNVLRTDRNTANSVQIGNSIGGGSSIISDGAVQIGSLIGEITTTAQNTVQIGYGAGRYAIIADHAVQVGYGVGAAVNTASNAVQIGRQVGSNTNDATNAIQIGTYTGLDASSVIEAIQMGFNAGRYTTDTNLSVQIGSYAGYLATNSPYSVHIGHNAGLYAKTSSYSVFIGESSGVVNSASNALYSIGIGYNAKVSTDHTCIIGGTGVDAVSVGIGTATPGATLHVQGNISASSVTASLLGTASWAENAVNGGTTLGTGSTYPITASWSNNSTSASYFSPYSTYYTITTGSNNGITCSFNQANQQINLTTALAYSFASSNLPAVGQSSDVVLYISHSSATTSSLSFPSTWINIDNGWPTSINGNTLGTLWLRAVGTTTIIGSLHTSGNTSASYAISASYAPVEPSYSASISTIKQNTLTVGGNYTITASWANNSTSSSYAITASYAKSPIVPYTLTDAATIVTDINNGNHFRVTLAGNRTLGNPTNGKDGERILWEFIQDATGSRTITLDTAFRLSKDIPAITLTTESAARDYMSAVYNTSRTAWDVTSLVRGYNATGSTNIGVTGVYYFMSTSSIVLTASFNGGILTSMTT